MKKALDYVSDYQLKSACKNAICCFIAKSRGKSLTHVKSAIRIRIFIFYLLRQSSIPPVGHRTLDVSTTAAAPTTLLLVILGNQGWLW